MPLRFREVPGFSQNRPACPRALGAAVLACVPFDWTDAAPSQPQAYFSLFFAKAPSLSKSRPGGRERAVSEKITVKQRLSKW